MKIELYTDGACRGNGTTKNLVAGYGCVLLVNGKERYAENNHLGFQHNTNNKAELWAVIEGFNMIFKYFSFEEKFEKDDLLIYSDSAYLINGITNWINGWRANGWINSKKEEVKNKDLWQRLDEMNSILDKYFNIKYIKIKGHSDNIYNNKCDELANLAMDKFLGIK